MNKGSGDSLGRDVRNGNDLGPTGKSVDASKHIWKTIRGRQWTYEINVYSVKTTTRSSERGEWGDCVALHFGFLTLQAGTGPSAYVCVDAWPNIAGSHQVLSGSNARV